MALAFSFLKHITQCQTDKNVCNENRRSLVSSPSSFPSESRAASVRADTNKENIPLSGGSSSGSVAEDTGGGVDSQEDQSGHAERTPKPRKCKHSPTLVQLTDNQDAHTVSHLAFSPRLFPSLGFVTILTASLPTGVFGQLSFSVAFIFSLTVEVRG